MEQDEIAIIGAGCRFPGADNIDEFWRVLVNGENHVRDIPESRWNNAAFFNEDPTVPGKTYVKKAGLLNNHDKWDNRLFGISEVEASRIDPQQRYVLECVHMAMEDGGLTRKQMSGTKTGVIIGCMNNDYSGMANYDLAEVGGYNATGTSASVISARVSYVYNLHGTCLTLDTACSSALVAIHLASQSIRTGDCEMMICGGVNSILSPDIYIALCKARMMSATGQCQSFCETADGYARGEGCGIVILKNLKAARRDGNKIWGVIKTGSNQDGCSTKPITAPSGDQQMKLLERVYDRFQFNPTDIQYIEAHGTGTPRGDPTELNALGKFFSVARNNKSDLLFVGSVKSNIGHTESAAGIAGLLKVLLMMNNGKYVPSLHVKADKSNVNTKIKLSEYGLDIPTNVTQWHCDNNGDRHACLNSFGFGGSNTHAIITVKENTKIKTNSNNDQMKQLPICISGVDQEALKQNLLQFHADLDQSSLKLTNIAVTSLKNRDIFPYRTLVIGYDKKGIQKECVSKAEKVSELLPKRGHNKVFVYCGVGTTWTGMCQELMKHNHVFSNTIHEIDHFLYPLTNWNIADKFKMETNYDDPFLNHIAIFCVQVGLTEVWKSYGIKPDKIIGQSVGEVAAAYASKCVSLEEAVNIIYYRSLILAKQSEGAMTVVGNIDVSKVEDMCSKYENRVCVAVYSSPRACTISGYKDDVNKLTESLKNGDTNSDLLVRELKVKCAYHSPILEVCMDEIRTKIDKSLEGLASVNEIRDTLPLLSTVTGALAKPDELRTGKYWATNIRQPVKFMQSIRAAFEDEKHNVYLEIGPRPVLKAHISNIFASMDGVRLFPSMLVKRELQCMYGSLSEMFETGIDINVSDLTPTDQLELTKIPRYVFNRTSDLFIPNKCKAYMSGSKNGSSSHLYVQTLKSVDQTVFKILLDEQSTPFVFDHYLSNTLIVPGATYIEAGFQVGQELLKKPAHFLSVGFTFEKTFTPSLGRQSELQVHIDPTTETNLITLSVKGNENVLANGTVKLREKNEKANFDVDYIKQLCSNHKSRKNCYDALKQFNFSYGDSLSLIQEAWLSDSKRQCLVEIKLPESITKDLVQTHFHPAALDSTFQIFGIIVKESLKDAFAVPKGVDSVLLNRSLEEHMFGYAEEISRTVNSTHYNAVLMTVSGTVIAEVENFYTRVITDEIIEDKSTEYGLEWVERDHQIGINSIPHQTILISKEPDTKWIQELKEIIQITEKGSLDEKLLSKDDRHKTISLIYHVGSERKTEQNLYYNAVERFIEVQKLMISKDQANDNLELTIITENTQACPDRKCIGYSGSELWGMIRSSVHEGFYGKVKLIDIDPNNIDISVLLSIISTKSNDDLECAISGFVVYRPRLVSGFAFKKQSRLLSIQPSDVMSIHSTSSNSISSPYLLVAKTIKPKGECSSVKIESFTVHSKSLYIQNVGDVTESDCILQNDQENNQIVIIEGKGRDQETDKEVFFLYPVKARTTLEIPKDNIFEAAHCPFFQSGFLIQMNFIVHITQTIGNGENIAVFNNTDDGGIGVNFFKYLLERKQSNVRFLSRKDFQNEESVFEEQTLIIAAASSVENWNLIVKYFPNLKKVVTISTFMPDNLILWIKHNFMDVNLTVIQTTDILTGNKIAEASPKIRWYLKKCVVDVQSTSKNNFILKLPMKTFDLKMQIEKGSLVCYCSSRNIFRSNASYIVVGGLTGLGWELLEMFTEMGAKTLITMSRSDPSEIIRKKIMQLQKKHGCNIFPMKVDVCNMEEVKQAFKKIDIKLPGCPIKGIFHGAGIVNDSVLLNLDLEKVKAVMKPKIQGTWNLHIASLNCSLDYFIVHSSIVSVLGNPGQCNYAAANSFLDSFALYRRSKGLPAQSINWGALGVGMAAKTSEIKEKLKLKGFNLVESDKMRENFIQAVVTDSTSTVFADIDWETLLSNPTFGLQEYKFNEFQKTKKGSKGTGVNKASRLDMDDFKKLDDKQKDAKVNSVLREIVHLVLVAEKESLTDDTRLTDIGIDSMAAMSLSNAIYETFGFREPVVKLLSEETTLSKIIRNILQYYEGHTIDDKNDTNNSEVMSEFTHIFASRNITFMQKDILDKSKNDRTNPYLLLVIDIEVIGQKLSLSEWKKLVKHTLKINPELRQRYNFSTDVEGGVSAETLSFVELPLSITEMSSEEFEESLNYDVREKIVFDIHNSLPVSIQVAEDDGKTMFRLILHKVAFDMKSLTMFCMDLEDTFESYLNNKELPVARPHVDVTNAVREAILPRMNDLRTYWRNYLNCSIKPVTFGPSLQEPDPDFCRIYTTTLSSSMVSKIKSYIAKEGISLYEFTMSLYQLFLYIGSGSTLVTVGTAADMRFHVPELNNTITRCANYIPIVADVVETESVTDFIKRNSIQLSKTTQNGAYPEILILENIKSPEMRSQIYRHTLSMNDMSRRKTEPGQYINSIYNIRRILHSRPTRETFMYVQYDMKKERINLELGHNSKICGYFGNSFSDIILYLADKALCDSLLSVKDLKEEVNTNAKNGMLSEKEELEMYGVVYDEMPSFHEKSIEELPKSYIQQNSSQEVENRTLPSTCTPKPLQQTKDLISGNTISRSNNKPDKQVHEMNKNYDKNRANEKLETTPNRILKKSDAILIAEVEKRTLSTACTPRPLQETKDLNSGNTIPSCNKRLICQNNEINQNNDKNRANGELETTPNGILKKSNDALISEIEKRTLSTACTRTPVQQMKDLNSGNTISGGHNRLICQNNEIKLNNNKNHANGELETTPNGILKKSDDVLISGKFSKQTSHGWDHKVDVALKRDTEERIVIEWGKDRRIRKKTSTVIELNNIKEIVMRKINDLQSIIIVTGERKVVLKTPDRKQAELWMNEIQKALIFR